jgi:ADP-ribose pyrophosphatase
MTEIYRGKRMRIEKVTVALPDGSSRERIVVRPGQAVAMLPVEGDWCYLIRQYRYPIDRFIYEVPAGTMDEGETPAGTAVRELAEEAKLQAKTLIPKGFIYTTPGFTDEVIHLFEARDLVPCHDHAADDDEIIEVVKVPVREVGTMIEDGRIVDAKTICLACRCLGGAP